MLDAPACPKCSALLVRGKRPGEYRCTGCGELARGEWASMSRLQRVGEIALALLAPAMLILVVVIILLGACTVRHVHEFKGAVVCKRNWTATEIRCAAEKADAVP